MIHMHVQLDKMAGTGRRTIKDKIKVKTLTLIQGLYIKSSILNVKFYQIYRITTD